jgi:nitroreductase
VVDFFETVEKRASVRSFSPCDLPDDELLQIVDAGRRAPSGYNRQPWEFIVIQDHSILAQLGRIQACIADSSAAVAVVVDEEATPYVREDAGAAIENMLLAVVALGYASLWVEGYVLQHEEYGKQVLGVPERLRLLAVLPIGKPVSPPVQAGKKDLKKITYTNRYGNPWKR